MTLLARIALCCAALAFLSTCGKPVEPSAESLLLFDEAEVARSEKIGIFIPGAFSSVDIFDRAASWSERGYALVFYRLPGMDGAPVAPPLSIDAAASEIADFVSQHPGRPVVLVGFSTGGPIALLAAERVQDGRPVSVAAVSSAVEMGGGLQTLFRGARDVTSAVLETGSLRAERFWLRYWQALLFGPRALDDPAFQAPIMALTRQYGQDITIPNAPLVHAHTSGLARWSLQRRPDLDHAKVGFFIGMSDPVISTKQTLAFRDRIGTGTIFGYPEDGHLLVLTQTDLFETILKFVEATR